MHPEKAFLPTCPLSTGGFHFIQRECALPLNKMKNGKKKVQRVSNGPIAQLEGIGVYGNCYAYSAIPVRIILAASSIR